MRMLSDSPGDLFAPFGAAAAPAVPRADERALWRRLAGSGEAWDAPAPPVPEFWARGYLVARAPRSQYDDLRAADAAGDLPEGPLFTLAGEGGGFHGQHGRPWCAPRGNLHLCAALPADLPAAACGPVLPALAATAACDAAARFAPAGAGIGIKWVNDVLLDGAKLGGVLTAARAVDHRLVRVFLGIGLNVAVRPQLPPGDGGLPPASLAGAGAPAPDPGAVAAALLAALADRWRELEARGPASLEAAYRRLLVAPPPATA